MGEKLLVKLFFVIVTLTLLSTLVMAEEKYSYENAEELTPLIEWRDYGPDAFQEALDQDKPIFLLLTAPSWCYWCQVYESEDYLFNSAVVEVLNRDFIPIYVDADKPDTPTSITIAPDGGTVEDLVDYADDYASYFIYPPVSF